MIVKTWLPVFEGFYGTLYDTSDNENIERYLEEQGAKDEEISEYYYTKQSTESYEEYQENVVSNVTGIIKDWLVDIGLNHIDIVNPVLYSPKAYNFSNDSINCTVLLDRSGKSFILRYLRKYKYNFGAYIRENYSSRSGFSSWYSNNYRDWFKNIFGEHELGAVLQFILYNENELNDRRHDTINVQLYCECMDRGNCYEFASYETLQNELKEKGFYDDKPELLFEILKTRPDFIDGIDLEYMGELEVREYLEQQADKYKQIRILQETNLPLFETQNLSA